MHETLKLLRLQKYISHELRRISSISMIPFHVIQTYIFPYVDYRSKLAFMLATRECFATDKEYVHEAKYNCILGSFYNAIHQYAQHVLMTCRYNTTRYIFCNWSPFSKKKVLPVATVYWNTCPQHTGVFFDHRTLEHNAAIMCKKHSLQARLVVHEESLVPHKWSSYANPRWKRFLVVSVPKTVIIIDATTFFELCSGSEIIDLRRLLDASTPSRVL